ncbi:MAG TPA: MGMT family protein [Gemmatimonadaceae bacterium]|nr:MGMT family protein [Gemmatimonadaceae bacterium]
MTAARGRTSTTRSDSHRRILAVVRRIPRGRVATYGQVALLAGLPRHARLVGYALHALQPDSAVPWHRVINAQGRVSPRAGQSAAETTQRIRLAAEGVRFDASGRTSLKRYGWRATARRSP